jgi:kinesin family protein 2/24
MDSYFFENRDFFASRIQQLENTSNSIQTIEPSEISGEVPDTAVCVRIRPLTNEEIGQHHIQGVLRDNFGAANIYEPRRKVNSKPDLNVWQGLPYCDIDLKKSCGWLADLLVENVI